MTRKRKHKNRPTDITPKEQPPEKILNSADQAANMPTEEEYRIITNSLTGLLSGLSFGVPGHGSQIDQVDTLFKNNRWYMISNMRQILSELYVEHGIIQTLVDQPVDDGFRKGVTINSGQLDEDEIHELQVYVENNNLLNIIAQGMKWARLYGGGGVLLITGQNPQEPLKELKKGDTFELKSVDMWELFFNKQNVAGGYDDITPFFKGKDTQFNYYGHNVNASRVLIAQGKEAPSFVRPRLRGWGMSEVERMVRSFNSYLKNSEVIFELLDEAKIDVYKYQGFNSAIASREGTTKIQQQAQTANQLKSFLNAIVMDKDDEYEQKVVRFSGLGEMLTQIRQGIASDLKMPITKLFGVSSAGFSSGEDDIENYNSMIESEIRQKAKPIIISVLKIACQALFGLDPKDMTIEFPPLRVLSAEQEENVKAKKQNRFSTQYAEGMYTDQEYAEVLKKNELTDMDTEVLLGKREAKVPESPASFETPTDSLSTQIKVST
ncbi:MAG: DUF1073 domain-containing protein [Deltaproteobacteria bacterium]|nr:DUF1073 domain-containing protein [Deltaproteobacteria bacterium]